MKVSIRWAIILGSLVLIWGTHLIVTPSSYISSERVLTKHAKDIMVNISDLTLEQSFNHLNKAKSAAYLANQLLSSNVVSSDDQGLEALERYFFEQLVIYPHLAGIYIGTPDGNFFMVSRDSSKTEDGFRTKIINHSEAGRKVTLLWRNPDFSLITEMLTPEDPYDPRTRPWYIKALREKKIVWTAPYIFYSSKKPGVTIAGPTFDHSGKLKGIVGVDIDIAELSTFIGKLRVGKSGNAFMINRNGDVIAYKNLEKYIVHNKNTGTLRLPKLDELEGHADKAFQSVDWAYDDNRNLILSKPVVSSFEVGGNKYFSMFTPFPTEKLPWIIGVFLPEDDYLGAIKSNRLFNIATVILISGLATWLGLILSKSIIYPIINLQNEARAIEDNDLTSSFATDSIYEELQETADAFSRMKTSLIEHQEELKEKESISRAITTTANDAIIMMDHNHRISYWNPAAERMFGYSSSEVSGKNLHETLAPRSFANNIKRGLQSFLMDGNGPFVEKTVEINALHKSGTELPIELSLSRLKIKGEWHAVAIIRDITERKKNEQLKKRLVNDLHDGVGGSLTNIKLLAEMNKNSNLPPETLKTFKGISVICKDSITEIRNYMNALEEKSITWQSVAAELRQYCNTILEPYNIAFFMECLIDSTSGTPSTLLHLNIFKIIKEALTNVAKHAEATEVTLIFHVSSTQLTIKISDNGEGFSSKDMPQAGSGRGLLSMESRASEFGGTLQISHEDGFSITLSMPLPA